jgi:hypothetical protein
MTRDRLVSPLEWVAGLALLGFLLTLLTIWWFGF